MAAARENPGQYAQIGFLKAGNGGLSVLSRVSAPTVFSVGTEAGARAEGALARGRRAADLTGVPRRLYN